MEHPATLSAPTLHIPKESKLWVASLLKEILWKQSHAIESIESRYFTTMSSKLSTMCRTPPICQGWGEFGQVPRALCSPCTSIGVQDLCTRRVSALLLQSKQHQSELRGQWWSQMNLEPFIFGSHLARSIYKVSRCVKLVSLFFGHQVMSSVNALCRPLPTAIDRSTRIKFVKARLETEMPRGSVRSPKPTESRHWDNWVIALLCNLWPPERAMPVATALICTL